MPELKECIYQKRSLSGAFGYAIENGWDATYSVAAGLIVFCKGASRKLVITVEQQEDLPMNTTAACAEDVGSDELFAILYTEGHCSTGDELGESARVIGLLNEIGSLKEKIEEDDRLIERFSTDLDAAFNMRNELLVANKKLKALLGERGVKPQIVCDNGWPE